MPVSGASQFADRIRELARRVDMDGLPGPYTGGSLADDLRQLVAEHHIRRTGRERGPEGPWAPLDPAYVARKRREGYPATIGVRTGEMLDPRQFTEAQAAASNTMLIVGYGVTEEARRRMGFFQRRRPALGPDAELRRDVEALIREAVADRFRSAGFRGG